MVRIYILFLVFCFSGISPLLAQSSVWSQEVELALVNVRGAPVVAGYITTNLKESGKVIVSFDGICISTTGDLIVLAASNYPDWDTNDGNVGVEAVSADNNTTPFSHTRVYDVNAGEQTFYAIAHNYVETAGTGIITLYGNLTVEFVPSGSDHIVASTGITVDDVNVDIHPPVPLAQVSINPPTSGKAIVKFNGQAYGTEGDIIVLAASKTGFWGAGPGNVHIETFSENIENNTFCHTQIYDVSPGTQTFYALAQNYVEKDGQGTVSVYGTLTVEFIPNTSTHQCFVQPIEQTFVDVEGAPVVMTAKTLTTNEGGKVLVGMNGVCYASVGDRIVLGVNDEPDWDLAPGSVSAEVINSDIDAQFFSTYRLFDVPAGIHAFYAIAENDGETDGNGVASIYGNFTVRFFPNSISSSKEQTLSEISIELSPNPTPGLARATAPSLKGEVLILVSDASGKVYAQAAQQATQEGLYELELSHLPAGTYFLTMTDGMQLATKAFAKL